MIPWLLAILLNPLPASAATAPVPPTVLACVEDLNTEYNAAAVKMAVEVYTQKFIDCFTSAGAEKILPANTGNAVHDFAGAACVVAAERDYRTSEDTPAAARRTYTASMADCYQRFTVPPGTVVPSSSAATAVFTDTYDDTAPLTTEQSLALATCLRQYVGDGTKPLTAEQNRQMANCFLATKVRPNIAQSYENMATFIDCAHDATGISGLGNITAMTPKQQAYYEKCVTTKVIVPFTTGAVVAAVPLAAGFGNIFLYFQFLFTQPAMLFRRRKGNRGQVVDSLTLVPLDLSTVRLLKLPERSLVKTIVTGSSGDYIFVPPPGDYVLEALRRDYIFPSQYHEGYRGEPLAIATADQVVDKVVPLDRKKITISAGRFIFAKWRRRLGALLAIGAPIISLVGCVLTPRWWTIMLCAAQFLLLFLFYRLGKGSRARVFGVVRDEQGRTLSGTVVSLFDKKFNKLLYYSVTDLFGRYTLPEAQGVFAIAFTKPGYTTFRRDFSLNDKLASADILLTKASV